MTVKTHVWLNFCGALSQFRILATIPDMDSQQSKLRLEFEALVIEHHARLRALVRSLGVDPDWVDDVAQEAFLTAYRQWDSFDQERDFGKWVRGIAANIVRNETRKEARRQRILNAQLAEILLSRHAESKERQEPLSIDAIRQCIGELAPKSQQAVNGRYRDGLSAPQLAEQLETTAANVRQILVRARRQVKQCVELRILKEV